MDFNPTTTRTAILANNTSASSSFPGWPNGVSKPSAIGLAPLGVPQAVFAHRCDWWGYGNHPDIGIKSNDQAYCTKTVADMKARGLAGALPDWYGPGSNEDKSLLALKPALEAAGLRFAICADKGIHGLKYDATMTDAQRTTILLNALAYARTTYFSSPAYMRVNGKPVILFFGVATGDFDWVKIRAALSDCVLIFRWEIGYSPRSYADGYFGWTHCNEAWVADLKAKCPGKLIILGINGGFDSSHKEAPILCTWGSGNIIPQNGGLTLQAQLDLARAHPEITLGSLNTWNDYQEGSALEPGIASGGTLSLAFDDPTNTLSWTDPGAAFDHLTLYVSKDGENLMPVADAIHGVTQVPLAGYSLPVGPWTFVLAAVGKNSIQNVVSNPVTIQEFVDWK